MQFARLVKAVEKAGLKVEAVRDGRTFHVQGKNYYGKFHKQDEQAICVSVCRNGDAPDSMVDYFPQHYHDTIKGFVSDLVNA